MTNKINMLAKEISVLTNKEVDVVSSFHIIQRRKSNLFYQNHLVEIGDALLFPLSCSFRHYSVLVSLFYTFNIYEISVTANPSLLCSPSDIRSPLTCPCYLHHSLANSWN